MKPIRLEITGLNSYIDKQVIDFEKLTERGLFGIFGNTGSGKSTILDAITIAMYGDIARNTKEYINSSCDKAIVSYEFEIGSKNSKRRYIVDRTIVRSKTGIKTSHARLIEVHGDNSQTVIADKASDVKTKITQLIGLTSEDFTRSVVLPQGKFNDFLKLTGSDRRNMLERIFGLEKYGRILIDKVRIRKGENVQKLRDVNSKLSQYENTSEELYKKTLRELELLKITEQEKNLSLEYNQKKYEENKIVFEEQTKLDLASSRKKELDLRKNDIDSKVIQLENAQKADLIHPHIIQTQSLEKDISEGEEKIEYLDKRLNILEKELVLTKLKYDEAYKLNKEKLPKLSEEKIKLETAKNLENEIINIDIELKDIKQKGELLNKDKEKVGKDLNENESKKENLSKSIKEIDEKLQNLNISADLKQKIFLAFDYEKEYNKLFEEKKINVLKLEQLTKEFEDINLKIKYIQKDREVISKKLEEESDHVEVLNKKSPLKDEDLLADTEKLLILKSRLENVYENETKKSKVQDELNTILEQKHKVERELSVLNSRLESVQKNILDTEKEVDRLKYINLGVELRKNLKENMPCPVCGSRHHENFVADKSCDELDFTKLKLEKFKNEEQEIKKNIENFNAKKSEISLAEKLKTKEIEEIKFKLGEDKYQELSKKYDEENKRLEALKNNVSIWEKEKLESENKLSKYKEEKNEIEKIEIQMIENINSYKKTIKELNITIENIDSNFNDVKEKYMGLKNITKISNFKDKVEEININEKIIEQLNKEKSLKNLDKDQIDTIIRNDQNKLHQIEIELISAREKFQEKRNLRENKQREVVSITKGESSTILLSNLEEEMIKIISQEENTKKKLEEQQVEYDKFLAEKHNIDGRLKIAKDQYKSQSKTLEQLLYENKFDSIYTVKRSFLDVDLKRRLNEEITQYNEEYKLVSFRVSELSEKLDGRRVKKEEFEELKNEIYNLKLEIGNISKDIGAKQNELEILKENIKKVIDLTKELKVVQHKVDLLEDLDKIIQGNRFVEYVATNQLKYIALEASKRLESITKGRYALEIDSTLNFVMRDNFNGGMRRSVDTLSGGETFLTSLSLALALSSQIQLKGNAPLEFFFLDEGFGSLDSDLLEIVMSSLERLHSDRLSVGIISHVDELKNRVPIKLLVTPSDETKGSKVKIEYS